MRSATGSTSSTSGATTGPGVAGPMRSRILPIRQGRTLVAPVSTRTCENGPNGDMFMNYMDYTADACMFMFTADRY